MLLCLDVGNSNIHGGIYKDQKIVMQFRYDTASAHVTSDQIGIFLLQLLKENDYQPKWIQNVAICSVVPNVNHSLSSAIKKYFQCEPFFIETGIKTGLKIKYPYPREIGSDMIAAGMAAINLVADKHKIIIDMGTATVFNPINRNSEFLGAVITSGIQSSITSLSEGTSQLSPVNIKKVTPPIGKTTAHCIQAGLYYGTRGAIREIIDAIMDQYNWHYKQTQIIATGGFAQIFSEDHLFDAFIPDLVLQGIQLAFNKNCHVQI